MKSLVEALDKSLRDELWANRNVGKDYYEFENQFRKFGVIPTVETDRNGDPVTLYLTNSRHKEIGMKLGILPKGFFFIYDEGTEVYIGGNKWFDVKDYKFEETGEMYGDEYLYAFSKTNARILKDILLFK